MLLLLWLAAAGVPPEIRHFQDILMSSFMKDVSPDVMRSIERSAHVCDWPPYMGGNITCQTSFLIVCTNTKIMTKLNIENLHERFHPEFAPNTLWMLQMKRCEQKYAFDVRSLPIASRVVDFSINALFGRLVLADLPTGIVELYATANKFTGPIEMTRLPPKLKILRLDLNKLKQQTMFYGSMPDHIETISVDGNKIQTACPVEPEESLSGKNVLKGFRHVK